LLSRTFGRAALLIEKRFQIQYRDRFRIREKLFTARIFRKDRVRSFRIALLTFARHFVETIETVLLFDLEKRFERDD
jgi:hypothetical protein